MLELLRGYQQNKEDATNYVSGEILELTMMKCEDIAGT